MTGRTSCAAAQRIVVNSDRGTTNQWCRNRRALARCQDRQAIPGGDLDDANFVAGNGATRPGLSGDGHAGHPRSGPARRV